MQLGRKIQDKERRVLGAAAGAERLHTPPRRGPGFLLCPLLPFWAEDHCCSGLGSVCIRPGWSLSRVPRPSAALTALLLLPEALGARAGTPTPRSSELPQPSSCTGWRETTAQPGAGRPPCSHFLGQWGGRSGKGAAVPHCSLQTHGGPTTLRADPGTPPPDPCPGWVGTP